MSDAPIEPQDFTYGVNVVQIEDLRIARGLTKRPATTCRHKSMVYDHDKRRIWCEGCETEIEPFDAFLILVENWDRITKSLNHIRSEVEEAERFHLRSRAAKKLDEIWRRRDMAPLCPHCDKAILPEDIVNGVASMSRSFAKRLRDLNAAKTKDTPDA